ncbi:Gelsolin [Leucoagaricus sp. SymC.cos]|nr:Gelsolin [Leucoagaricus sp. SymC.cos]
MEPVTPSRRGTFDLPKPETGLAEWTSKIKALQRQVDADEEAEQKRLEEEIATARRARLRRSRGAGYGGDSMDLSVSPSALGNPSSRLSKSPPSEVLKSPFDRRTDHDDAPRKLPGFPSSSNIDTSSITQGILPRPSQLPAAQPPPSQRPEPISLAAFIGGRATGPRLNRHAPQQDASDPTLFEQRSITGPHPVFGKGGVAMPGMVPKAGTSVRDAVKESEAVERYQPRTTSTPSIAVAPFSHQIRSRPISPQKSGNRERTLSTPSSNFKSTESYTSRIPFTRPNIESPSPNAEQRPKSPGKDHASTPSRSSTPSRGFPDKLTTPRQVLASANISVSPSKTTISTPSLARAILPEPRLSPQIPIISSNVAPSPAFQKSPPQKDPTPSISRLQGRGFVQNMVRASTQLENTAKSVPSSPASRPSSGRKSSVLDRWQPNVAPSSPTPAPVPRQASPVRKVYSELPSKTDCPPKVPTPTPSAPSSASGKVPKTKTSHLHPDPLDPPEPLSPRRAKMAEKMLPPEGGPGFGSATTMVVYKPKTPEKPPLPVDPNSTSGVDELGVRRDPSSDDKGRPRFSVPSELPAPAGKPLNHPTKQRARKPKKNRDASHGELSQVKLAPEPVKEPRPSLETAPPIPRSRSLQLSRTPSPTLVNEALPPSPSFSKSPEALARTVVPSEKEVTSNVAQISQKWAMNAPIGVKPVASSQVQAQSLQHEIEPKSDNILIRRALPGMDNLDSLRTPSVAPNSKSPSPESTLQASSQTKSSSPSKSNRLPRSPSSPKHTRIPSTGNRALVMDVAQAFNEYNANASNEPISRQEVMSPPAEPVPEPAPKPRVAPSLERRRSSYDRFSVVSVMPPLKEEATPHGTPYGTLTRTPDDTFPHETTLEVSKIRNEEKAKNNTVHFEFRDTTLPNIDVLKLLQPYSAPPLLALDAKTISVDVLAIHGNISTAVSRDADIFYDSELLAIIHRYKSKSSGLVSTQLWVWYGKKSDIGDKEERKIQELAKRYNTSPTVVCQHSEPPPLVHLLGGTLIVRQGSRSHWSAENTAMYSIRNLSGVTFIDEHDLSVRNLCSAFSYCLTILDTVYVWHGCGSTGAERQAALKYASRISEAGTNVIHLNEGENDQDELFWMVLGEEEFARADYWQWRRRASDIDPRIWRVDARADSPIIAVSSLRSEVSREKSIFIIDCIWELFVKVGSAARGDRASIKLALNTAKRLSEISASSRPFTPTVHVLVLPSRLPLDLRLNLRGLDESEVNNGEIPDHMNLLSSTQAESHLRQHTWERMALQDETMLPLGLSASDAQ